MLGLLCVLIFVDFTQGDLTCSDGMRIIECSSRPLRPEKGVQYYTTSLCAIENVSSVINVTVVELRTSRSCMFDETYCETYADMDHINNGVFDYTSDNICVGWGCQASFEICAGRTTTSSMTKTITPLRSETTQEADLTEIMRKLSSPQWKSSVTKTTTANISPTEKVSVSFPLTVPMPMLLTTTANSIKLTAATKLTATTFMSKSKGGIEIRIPDSLDTGVPIVATVGTSIGTLALSVIVGLCMRKLYKVKQAKVLPFHGTK